MSNSVDINIVANELRETISGKNIVGKGCDDALDILKSIVDTITRKYSLESIELFERLPKWFNEGYIICPREMTVLENAACVVVRLRERKEGEKCIIEAFDVEVIVREY